MGLKDIKPADLIRKIIPGRPKKKWALVLEGGAMRCIFTAGVLDAIQETAQGRFDFILSVSAGAGCGVSFMADQKGRSQKIFLNYLSTSEFIDFRRFLKGRHIMDLGYAIKEINDKILPINVEKYSSSKTAFYTVLTCAETGEPVCIKPDKEDLLDAIIASCNLPYLTTHPAEYKGRKYVDGGVAIPIPLKMAVDMGAEKIVTIMTRPEGFHKTKSRLLHKVMSPFFKEFRNLSELLQNDDVTYNINKTYVENFQSDTVEHFPIVPPADFKVDRLTTRQETLKQGYAMGVIEGLKLSEKLKAMD
ncbi:MAG: patatin family protein [Lentisphaeraceae bacterium]|nr:patatin family protein [Lentisphaeraceae bacterium]